MNHSDIQNRMADYLEGDLSLRKRALFDAHLDTCPDCSSELGEMRRTIALLRRLPTPQAPADLADNVMRRIAEGEGQPGWIDHIERWFGEFRALVLAPGLVLPATALAAGLTLVLLTADGGGLLPGVGAETPTVGVAGTRRPTQAAVQRPPGQPMRGVPAASGRPWEASLAQDNSGRGHLRLGLRGSRLANDGVRPPAAPLRSAGQHRLALAGTAIGGTAKSQSVRSRDEWLDVLIRQPRAFAREHSELSSVEQELWITHLSRRAVELERLEEAVIALRATGDPFAVVLAKSFAAAAQHP